MYHISQSIERENFIGFIALNKLDSESIADKVVANINRV